MAIYLYYLYFLAIHIIILLYYIFTLISNQSKYRIACLSKADGISVLHKLKQEFNITFPVEISNPKFNETTTCKMLSEKLVINSKYANYSYIENITIISVYMIGATNNWIRNEIFVKNYLTLSYYLTLLSVLAYIATDVLFIGVISILTLSIFTTLIIVDIAIRSFHSNLTTECLLELEIIDKEMEARFVEEILNIWKIKNLNVYYRLINDIIDFLKRRKKTSP
jgi:hypothetical protein